MSEAQPLNSGECHVRFQGFEIEAWAADVRRKAVIALWLAECPIDAREPLGDLVA